MTSSSSSSTSESPSESPANSSWSSSSYRLSYAGCSKGPPSERHSNVMVRGGWGTGGESMEASVGGGLGGTDGGPVEVGVDRGRMGELVTEAATMRAS